MPARAMRPQRRPEPLRPEPTRSDSQMAADGVRHHEEQEQPDRGVRDSEEVQVAGMPVKERGTPAQRERDAHQESVGRVGGAKVLVAAGEGATLAGPVGATPRMLGGGEWASVRPGGHSLP